MDVLSPFISVLILIDSSTESPVHVLMLSIKAVRGLPRLRAPGIVPVEEHLMQYNLFPNFCAHTGHTFFHHIQNNISLFQDCLTVKII